MTVTSRVTVVTEPVTPSLQMPSDVISPTSTTIYLDNAASTRVCPEVEDAMRPYFGEYFGNPSSLHPGARVTREAIELARAQVATALGCEPGEIIFTSGGTEGANLALVGAALANTAKGKHVIISAIEHQAVLAGADVLEALGYEVTRLPVDSSCQVCLEALAAAVRPDTSLVSVMLVNNETGSIQPLRQMSDLLRPRGVILHTDAVQGFGKIQCSVRELGVDLLSLSGHKIHGPKGIGALFVRRGVKIQRQVHGGPQEFGLRAGTENVPGIVGLGVAAGWAVSNLELHSTRLRALRDQLEAELQSALPSCIINSALSPRVPAICNVSFPRVNGNYLLNQLFAKGLCVTSGSACSSIHQEPSHVLRAMGMPAALCQSSIRFSLSIYSTQAEVSEAVKRVTSIMNKINSTVES